MPKGKPLNPIQEAAVVARYARDRNVARTAAELGVSRTSVRRVVARRADLMEAAAAQAVVESETMALFMAGQRAAAQSFISKALARLQSDDKLDKATVSQLAHAIGVVVDKWSLPAHSGDEGDGAGVVVLPAAGNEGGGESGGDTA